VYSFYEVIGASGRSVDDSPSERLKRWLVDRRADMTCQELVGDLEQEGILNERRAERRPWRDSTPHRTIQLSTSVVTGALLDRGRCHREAQDAASVVPGHDHAPILPSRSTRLCYVSTRCIVVVALALLWARTLGRVMGAVLVGLFLLYLALKRLAHLALSLVAEPNGR
jgi:hypothetical protein